MFDYFFRFYEKILNSFSSIFFRDKFILLGLTISVLGNIFLWFYLAFRINFKPEMIPLHYNIYFGIDLLGNPYKVLAIPLLALFLIIINVVLSYNLYIKERVLSYTLIYSLSFIYFILITSSIAIVWLNL